MSRYSYDDYDEDISDHHSVISLGSNDTFESSYSSGDSFIYDSTYSESSSIASSPTSHAPLSPSYSPSSSSASPRSSSHSSSGDPYIESLNDPDDIAHYFKKHSRADSLRSVRSKKTTKRGYDPTFPFVCSPYDPPLQQQNDHLIQLDDANDASNRRSNTVSHQKPSRDTQSAQQIEDVFESYRAAETVYEGVMMPERQARINFNKKQLLRYSIIDLNVASLNCPVCRGSSILVMNDQDSDCVTKIDGYIRCMNMYYLNHIESRNEWIVYEEMAMYWNQNVYAEWQTLGITDMTPANPGYMYVHYNLCDRSNPVPLLNGLVDDAREALEMVHRHGFLMREHVSGIPTDKYKITQTGPQALRNLTKQVEETFKSKCGVMMHYKMNYNLPQTILPGAAPSLRAVTINSAKKRASDNAAVANVSRGNQSNINCYY